MQGGSPVSELTFFLPFHEAVQVCRYGESAGSGKIVALPDKSLCTS